MAALKYKRILYKISGEVLAGDKGFGLDFQTIHHIAQEIIDIHTLGAEIGIVLGGGNIFRGSTGAEGGIDRVTGDYMGMLATVINALSLQDALEKKGIYTRVLTAIRMEAIAEPYIRRRALRHLEKGRVVIIAAGTGNPYFTTDTAAALRAVEIEAQVLLKGTKVDGIYDKDPIVNENAVFYEKITYQQVLRDNLKVMDAAAITLCRDNHLPIVVFNLKIPNQISRILQGEPIGTIICEE